MKSLLITTGIFAPDIGGPASYARALGVRLARDGVRVTVLTYSPVASHNDDANLPFKVCRVWRRFPWGFRHLVFFIRALLFARSAGGILALNAVSAGGPTALAARLLRKPFVVRIAGDYAWEIAAQTGATFMMIDDFQKQAHHGRIARLCRAQAATCRKAARVIVPSEYLAGLVAGWGVPRDKIEVIYNGVDLPAVSESREELRRSLGISGTVILSAGRLVPWKGFRMLIKLMPQLAQVNQSFRLVIVGDGPDMANLKAVARTLGQERKVMFAGRVNSRTMAQYLAASDMFVLNTGYEGFSHQVLEAMQAGLPVVTTQAGGNKEIIVQGENGLMVRYNDEFNLLDIKLSDPRLNDRMEPACVTSAAPAWKDVKPPRNMDARRDPVDQLAFYTCTYQYRHGTCVRACEDLRKRLSEHKEGVVTSARARSIAFDI
jgi:glycosyltransferase involved in cell wall biosynthesis